jgi:hypothetical protein
MAGKNISGTPKGINIDGLDYRFAGDVDINSIVGSTTNEMIPTSGDPMEKKEARIQSKEIILIVNTAEAENLKNNAEADDPFQISVEDASGSWHRTLGKINIDSYTSSENRMTINLLPSTKDAWTVTVG